MSRKGCELCTNPARMFCDSDQASLCWDCDHKVHAANFLVAKHSRTLLCHVCFSPTPWKAAGPSLGPTVSVCHACANSQNTTETESEPDRDSYSSETDDSSQEEEEDDDDDDEGENQVVPWSASASDSAPAASSSGEEEEEEEEEEESSSKRSRDDAFAAEEDSSFDACCSSQNAEIEMGSEEFHETNYDPLRFVRRRGGGGGGPSSGTAAIVEKLRRFEQQIVAEESDASAMIVGICNLTRE